jgi:hypothetical protein
MMPVTQMTTFGSSQIPAAYFGGEGDPEGGQAGGGKRKTSKKGSVKKGAARKATKKKKR